MPQRFFRSKSDSFLDIEGIYWATYTPGQDRALDRIGFGQGTEAEFEWFVRLSNVDLPKASEGEALMLLEEPAEIA